MSTEAMKLALEALEGSTDKTLSIRAITALQQALAEQPAQQEPGRNHWEDGDVFERIAAIKEQPAPVKQEPVAKVDANDEGYWADILPDRTVKVGQLLYAEAPQPAQAFVCSTGLCHYRKPLTDAQIETVWRSVQANDFHDCVKPFARAVEAAHGITATREHVTDDSQCWCNPEITYTDPDTGVSVIVHKEPQ